MLYAIAGVTGHTGRAAVESLLSSGARVRVIVRDAAKGAAWAARGAEVAVADLTDGSSLAVALRGVDGAYLLLPPRMAPGFRDYQRTTGEAIVAAVEAARPRHVVFLSSIGAELAGGTGPIAGLHPIEAGLRAVHVAHREVNVTLLRAGYFMENLGGSLAALPQNILPGFTPTDAPIPMVATVDIGRTAANLLREGGQGAQVVQIGGPDRTHADAAAALTRLLGRPIQPVAAPTSTVAATFQQFGFPADLAALYQEMMEAMVAGRIRWQATGPGVRHIEGTTSLETVLAGLLARTPLRVGVLGSGQVAQVLARGFAGEGHTVRIGSRDPGKLAGFAQESGITAGTFGQVAAEADVVVLAVKGTAAEEVARELGPVLAGRVVLDATNPIADAPPDGAVVRFFTGPNDSLLERLQAAAPQARFVKAFSSVGNHLMIHPRLAGGPPTMFIAGDDASAKTLATALLDTFGWEAEDVGDARGGRAIEPLCQLWCAPGFLRNDWTHAFKMLRTVPSGG